MSTNGMEKALWQALSSPKEMQRFREDLAVYLGDFRLDEAERAMMLAWDVRGIVDRGVNPLLIMSAFSAVNGPHRMGEYAMAINQPS